MYRQVFMKSFFSKALNAVPTQLLAVVVVSVAIVAILTGALYHGFQIIVQPLRD